MVLSARDATREALAGKIAGDVILSREPGVTMRKWRELFHIPQVRLAQRMEVSPSVISDYESGRRKSPGTGFLRRFVQALIAIDEEDGGTLIRELSRLVGVPTEAIVDVRDFPVPVLAKTVNDAVEGIPVACAERLDRNIYGYTIVSSVKAILTLSGSDFMQIFGTTTERALVFTNVSRGRSPMVAVRVSPLKPRMVVIHGTREVDPLGIRLAEAEQIPLVLSRKSTVEDLITALRSIHSPERERVTASLGRQTR